MTEVYRCVDGTNGNGIDNPVRLMTLEGSVLCLLVSRPGIRTIEIAKETGHTQRAVQIAVSKLSRKGLVQIERGNNTHRRYSVDEERIRTLVEQDAKVISEAIESLNPSASFSTQP